MANIPRHVTSTMNLNIIVLTKLCSHIQMYILMRAWNIISCIFIMVSCIFITCVLNNLLYKI